MFYSPSDFSGRVNVSEFAKAISTRKEMDREILKVLQRIATLFNEETLQHDQLSKRYEAKMSHEMIEQFKLLEDILMKIGKMTAHNAKSLLPTLVEQRHKTHDHIEDSIGRIKELIKRREGIDDSLIANLRECEQKHEPYKE